jgi:hydroxymethylglutaryl-CoA lyase
MSDGGAEVTIYEVGPRDGLQNEARAIPTAQKIALVDMLSATGLRRIEVTSFVSPRWIPQLADGAEVLAGIRRAPGVAYAVLVPNLKGFEAARASGVEEVAIFTAASETFSRRNINATIQESLERFAPVAEAAAAAGVSLRGYVSCITDCPYQGPTEPAAVASVVARLLSLGCREVALGETLGRATPERVAAMLDAVLEVAGPDRLAGHFHDTGGHALANVETCLGHGLRVFDAAVGGLGGCPYAPGAAGNVATEKVAAHLASQGHAHGLDMTIIENAAAFARGLRGMSHA